MEQEHNKQKTDGDGRRAGPAPDNRRPSQGRPVGQDLWAGTDGGGHLTINKYILSLNHISPRSRSGVCLYVSAPMRGRLDFGWPALANMTKTLRDSGFVVHNPAEYEAPGKPVHTYFYEDTKAILRCQGVVFAEDWYESAGCQYEYHVAEMCGIPAYRFQGLRRFQLPDGHPLRTHTHHNPVIPTWSPILDELKKVGQDPIGYQRYVQKGRPETILEEAERLTSNDRNDQYGDAIVDLGNIAAMWTLAFGRPFSPEDVALAMVLLKCMRQSHQHKRDNLVDLCGYARLIERIQHDRGTGRRPAEVTPVTPPAAECGTGSEAD